MNSSSYFQSRKLIKGLFNSVEVIKRQNQPLSDLTSLIRAVDEKDGGNKMIRNYMLRDMEHNSVPCYISNSVIIRY